MVWLALWPLDLCWVFHHAALLFPTSTNQLTWLVQERSHQADRLCRRILEHFWNDFVHGWYAMGWLSGWSYEQDNSSIINTKQYKWGEAHVLAPLIIVAAFIAAFVIWETKFARYPMFPARLLQAPRILALTLVITFISGANFFSIVMFWPTQAFNVYGHDPVGVGIRGIPIGFSILAGAVIVLWCLSEFRGRNKELMIVASICMTAGKCFFLSISTATFY